MYMLGIAYVVGISSCQIFWAIPMSLLCFELKGGIVCIQFSSAEPFSYRSFLSPEVDRIVVSLYWNVECSVLNKYMNS